MSDESISTREVTLRVAQGLHLTPIQQLVRKATEYPCQISLEFDGRTADVKSVFDLMLLAAPFGSVMTLQARGSKAEDAVNSLAQLFDGGFVITE
ncbi:MAG: HPr family phosphocarrier protein [Planctomyces sp.]|nr:HPr family phosphocarrier protein [Planctomyces sp.]